MTLIKSVRVHAPNSEYHHQRVDMRISRKGEIDEMAAELSPKRGEQEVTGKDLNVSPGWLDIGAYHGDPGHEEREDLEHLAAAALAGGFTALAPLPSTNPPIHSKSEVNYLLRRGQTLGVHLYPIGTVTENRGGAQLAEILDMQRAGAVAFYDGYKPIEQAGLLLRALQYAQTRDALVLHFPLDPSLSKGRTMHEGIVSTQLGLPGIPTLAEELAIQRDLSVLEYTGGRLHLMNITSAAGVALIKQAKRKKMPVTCSTSILHLIADQESLRDFDVNFRLHAPLRTATDRRALLRAVKDGTIDVVTTNHFARTTEEKMVEFPYAAPGAVTLEGAYAWTKSLLKDDFDDEWWLEKVAFAPRHLLGLPIPKIEPGKEAELTIWDAGEEWNFAKADLRSKGRNAPFLNQPCVGRIKGTVAKGIITLATH